MHDRNYKTILDKQQQFFASGETLSYAFRIEQLQKLKSILSTHENEIADALKKDLNKAPMEALVNEIFLVLDEIDYIIKRLKKWMKPQSVSTPFPILWPGHSKIYSEPYGSVLIIGPWNYPFLLILSPLIGAISAGNCVVLKPSDVATHTENLLIELINHHFASHYIAAVKANTAEMQLLLQEKFDYLFFTGGTQIGKVVMEAAAKHLTPVTLELGGKSPCIVDETATLAFAARRIAWAKTTNAGQVCIAPDYLYVHRSQKDTLVKEIKTVLENYYGDNPETSDSYARIINKKHFDRLTNLMQKGNILFGGQTNPETLYIAPTLIDGVSWDDPIMQEEIFGPILPIITYDSFDEMIQLIKQKPKPLALYLFTNNKQHEEKIISHVSFGGGCINDCIMHVANMHLPFGGVGSSGMGGYHGKYSFDTFSHRKSIYKKSMLFDLKLEYPPYSERKLWWVRKLFGV